MAAAAAAVAGNLKFGPSFAVMFLLFMAACGWELWDFTQMLRWRAARPHPTDRMAGVYYREHGDPAQILAFNDGGALPAPRCESGMVRIRVHAAALNPIDYKIMRHVQNEAAAPKPKIPGGDVAGVVVEAARGTGFSVGDKVYALLPVIGTRWGSLAEYVSADAKLFAPLPSHLNFTDAAALPLAGLTVLQSLEDVPPARSGGGAVLVQAGMGGVGSLAVQYARNVLGYAEVLATASGGNADALKALGATKVIDYKAAGLVEASDADFRRAIGRDVDVVFDPVSWAYEEKTLNSGVIKRGGTYVHILSSDWAFNLEETSIGAYLHSVVEKYKSRLQRLFDGGAVTYLTRSVAPSGADLRRLTELVEAGKLRPVVDRVYSFSDFDAAFKHLMTGHAKGKVVLVP
mmetsp:Transcript_17865/g.54674  ORF Transcript_17865/g.54674 Transcript_17865/m.54674 type:complete len:403 (-) Transcript_17865:939-2147(-)|eukprot:CAMPEP_0118850014 /NCGR_PEP_ID=MMETSP1163-20130328/72_1 /TAXON_ID=124430 /ORGANISM="Phaeomonas parva, Strain CCMP2877" /LENGTH=402 /DNA_ID=CAMNT_0006782211 /DNA_START=123 /DNA_END=1331 /DNA_ORIENTATION=+